MRKVVWVVERAALEMRYTRKRIEGSNPPLSAKKKRVPAKGCSFSFWEVRAFSPPSWGLLSRLCLERYALFIALANHSLSAKKRKEYPQGVLFFFLRSQSLLTPILGALISASPRTIRAIRSTSKSLTFRKIYSVKILFNKCNAPLIVLTCCITT